MRGFCMLAALAACTVTAQHGSHLDQSLPLHRHIMSKRQMRSSGLAGPSLEYQEDPGREAAFDIGSANYDQHVGKSTAAAASGGQSGVAAIWAEYLPSGGNPYGLFYAGNGRGDLARGRSNEYGPGTPSTTPGPPAGAPANDQGRAIISMMEQIGTLV